MDGWGFLADDDLSGLQKGLVLLVAPLILLGVPIQNDGHTMPLEERAMLIAGDGIIASNIGTEGMLATFDFLFWLEDKLPIGIRQSNSDDSIRWRSHLQGCRSLNYAIHYARWRPYSN